MERLTAADALVMSRELRTSYLPHAKKLASHAVWLSQVEGALREALIQLAIPPLQTATAQLLRDHIEALLGIVPRPVSQQDED